MSTETSKVVDLIPLPISVTALVREEKAMRKQHGEGLTVGTDLPDYIVVRTAGEICGCITCDQRDREALARLAGLPSIALMRQMVLCDDCGNKRCPKASHHANPCTGSNDTGQAGSFYE